MSGLLHHKMRACRVTCLGVLALLFMGLAASAQVQLKTPNDTLSEELDAAMRVTTLDADVTAAERISTAQGDYGRLIAVLYENGYYAPVISIKLAGREADALSPLTPPATTLPAQVSVDQGPPFTLGQARIAPLPKGTETPEGFRPGAPARLSAIRQAADEAISAWRDASYAKAKVVDQSISARHPQQKLDVVVGIEPGPALRFGQLLIDQDSAVREDRIRAIAGLPKGSAFDPAAVRRSRERLVETGAFRSVVLREANRPNADGTLDVELTVEDAAPRRIGFGAEIFSDEGLSVEAFWMHRNIFGGAERLRFDIDIEGIGGNTGGVDYTLGSTLSIPGYRRPDDTLTYSASLQRLNEATYKSDVFDISVRRDRQVNDQLTAGVGIGFRGSNTQDVFGTRSFRHLVFDVSGTLDARDDTLQARKGHYLDLAVQPFIGISGDASGVRITADARAYRSLGEKTVLAGRFQLGSVVGPALSETPPDYLFLSGGGGTVRGQSFQSLGVDVGGNLTGGRSFLGLSAEVRQDIGKNLGLVAFADFGFVAEDSGFSNGATHTGYGIGARYNTSLGPIRIDVGVPGNRKAQTDNVQLYIGLGEAF